MRTLRVAVAVFLLMPTISSTQGLARDSSKWCSRAHVRRLVHSFVDASNQGRVERLDALVAAEPDFAFFRVSPERPSPLADDRSTLLSYFRDRHDLGDRLDLVRFRLNKERGSSPSNIWGFGLELRRTSDDLAPVGQRDVHGQGCR